MDGGCRGQAKWSGCPQGQGPRRGGELDTKNGTNTITAHNYLCALSKIFSHLNNQMLSSDLKASEGAKGREHGTPWVMVGCNHN